VKLADGRQGLRTVRLTVDHQGTGSADALAAVVIECHWVSSTGDEMLVEYVQHLEERHVGRDIV
jgi:hypothetical protein